MDNNSGQTSADGGASLPQSSSIGNNPPTSELTYRFMYDLVVKMLFAQNPDLLQNLVAMLLRISPDSIKYNFPNSLDYTADFFGLPRFFGADIGVSRTPSF